MGPLKNYVFPLIIESLHITQFKNHSEKILEFSEKINCFVGPNGAGKTNILDALHYLSVGKSFLGTLEAQGISYGEDFFTLRARVFDGEKNSDLSLHLPKEGKKLLKRNDKPYPKLSEHIGYLPSVLISPYDSNLITDSGESRRKFLDQMISQTDSTYLFELISYQKTLRQRNALLKYFQKNRVFDPESLEIYTPSLLEYGRALYEKRKAFTKSLSPLVESFYLALSGGGEKVEVSYTSQLHEKDLAALLEENLSKDRVLSYTSAGLHKDDLLFEMNGHPLRRIASQGQQKTFLIALKLAQIKRLKDLTGKTPILLLDDIFDKLDDERVGHLITLLNAQNFGQMFITDTHKERTESIVKRIHSESRIFEI